MDENRDFDNYSIGRAKGGRPPGSEKRLWCLTYSQIATWAWLKPRTVQEYASRGEFDASSIESTLKWVNTRRRKAGLPMIGQPPPLGED
jgi:hypothetical protein